jgi:DNA-binding MarR family transcriptional regulator
VTSNSNSNSSATDPTADLDELSPTAAHVYRELQWSGEGNPVSISDLMARTGRAPSTIREARAELEDIGVVETRWSPGDLREKQLVLVE